MDIKLSIILLVFVAVSSTNATFFKYKYEKKQEFLDQLKGKRALSHGYHDYGQHLAQFSNGGYFGFTGYDNLFKHGITVPIPVPKPVPISFAPIPIPHPVPIATKTIAYPLPFHQNFNKPSLADFGLAAYDYDTAYANYAAIHNQHQQQQHHNYNHNFHEGRYGQYNGQQHSGPNYEPDCHPYCDINLPQGSSPVPLTTKEHKFKKLKKAKEQRNEEDQKSYAKVKPIEENL